MLIRSTPGSHKGSMYGETLGPSFKTSLCYAKKIAQGRRKLSVIFVPMKIPFESYWRVVIKSWL